MGNTHFNTGDIVSDSGDRYERPDRNFRPEGQRPGEAPSGRRNDGAGPAKGRPAQGGRPPYNADRPKRDDSAPRRDHAPRGGAGRDKPDEKRLWTKGGEPARNDRDARNPEPEEDRDPFNVRSVRARHDAPEIPEGVVASDLDRVARNELKTLEKENADGVALHLVMAAKLIDEDPELAHQHAISAARRAGRIGVVRETLAITAYATGDFALALRELRTYRRITGRDDQLPMMVDSERGIGRPDKALELGRSVQRSTLAVPVQVELAIAMSGARLDLEQNEAALAELEIPQLDPTKAFTWSPALFESYGAVLEELGRDDEAELWYTRADTAAEALESAGITDDNEVVEVIEEDFELEDPADDALDSAEDSSETTTDEEPGDLPQAKTRTQNDND